MNTSKIIQITLPVLTTVLLSVSALAQSESKPIPVNEVQPPTPANGSAADLEDLETKSTLTGSWNIGGGEYPDSSTTPYRQGKPEANDIPVIFQQSESGQQWQNDNRGDTRNQGAKVPVSQF
jgi:hypothetical protein